MVTKNIGHKHPLALTAIAVLLLSSCSQHSFLPPIADKSGVSVSKAVVVNDIPKTQQALAALLPAQVRLAFPEAVLSVYATQGGQLIWSDETLRREFEQQLVEIALAGVDAQFLQWATWLSSPQLAGTARELVLTDAMIGYLGFTDGVRAQGDRWLYRAGSYSLTRPTTTKIEQWQQSTHNKATFAQYLTQLAPIHPNYKEMRQVMNVLYSESASNAKFNATSAVKPGNTLTPTNKIALIDALNQAARWSGDNTLSVSDTLALENSYNSQFVEKVRRFQGLHGITQDGVISTQTAEWLNMSPLTRAKLMALNIQRLRLLPSAYDTRILVNIPDYFLEFYHNSKLILDSKVIVGSPSRKTPIMDNALRNVVINPPWNVPNKLAREDIIPKIKRDPNYVTRLGYSVYSDWSGSSSPVNPAEVDWHSAQAKNLRFQQSPGSSNALGRYKFNMPNSEAIYLHDTPNHRNFERSNRAISSGCIRVNKASTLASILINGVDGWSDNRISGTLKGGKTTYVKLPDNVPVHLFYLTAWKRAQGQTQFRNDIYRYDTMIDNVNVSAQQLNNLLPEITK